MSELDYFVECGDTLSNKLNISDTRELAQAEYDITARQTRIILATYHPKIFNLRLLLDLHSRLFGEIYDFAGKIRTVNIAKPDSPVPFCYADFITSEANRIFDELAEKAYLTSLQHDEFCTKLAYFASELNALHPFREGNGRTIRIFLDLLANNAGYLLDYAQASRNEILRADREAFAGNMTPIQNLYHKIVFKID